MPGSIKKRPVLYASCLALTALLLLAGGCDDLEYEGWLNKPIPLTLLQDVPLVQLKFNNESPTTSALETGSPFTVVDRGGTLNRYHGELRLQDGADPTITRFIFRDVDIYDLGLEPVGLNQSRQLGGLLGSSILRHFAVHLSYGSNPAVTLKDEIPDSIATLANDCRARDILVPVTTTPSPCLGVFPFDVGGGGLVTLGDEEIDLPATRLVLPLCLVPDPFDPTQPVAADSVALSGVPVTAVLSTGLGISVISDQVLERLRAVQPDLEVTPATLNLPYGSEEVGLVTIDRLSFVGDETIRLGPCGELQRRQRIFLGGRQALPDDDEEQDGASVIQLAQPIELAVLPAERPLLRGINDELGPSTPNVDLVLGGSILKYFEVDVDYPKNRLILQCGEGMLPDTCQVLPWCSFNDDPQCEATTLQ